METGLYYLNSRYYDPQFGWFINGDDLAYIKPEVLNGCNLFSYCNNNPVMFIDPSGHFWLTALIVGFVIGGAVSAGLTAISGGSGREILASFVSGAITGAVLGLAATIGGALAVGAIKATALTVSASLMGTTALSFVGGMGAYAAEKGILGQEINTKEMLLEGVLTSVQSLFNFGIGAALGASGHWESLKKEME